MVENFSVKNSSFAFMIQVKSISVWCYESDFKFLSVSFNQPMTFIKEFEQSCDPDCFTAPDWYADLSMSFE
jgi:hypothetical protein